MLAVVATVRFVLDRTDWTLGMILAALGVSRPTYHRWVGRPDTPPPLKRLQLYEILPEERQDIIDYARHHPNVRHQELAYKMLDALSARAIGAIRGFQPPRYPSVRSSPAVRRISRLVASAPSSRTSRRTRPASSGRTMTTPV